MEKKTKATHSTLNRNYGYDFLKIIATFSIVFQHSLGFNIEGINICIYYLASFGVPIFFMVNGALLLSKEEITIDYIGYKIISLVKLCFFWSFLYFVKLVIFDKAAANPVSLTFDHLRQGGFFGQFWFFGALIIIYITLPFWHKKFKDTTYAIRMTLTLISIMLIMDVLSIIGCMRGMKLIQISFEQYLRLWSWFGFFCLGGLLHKKEISDNLTKKITFRMNILLVIIFSIIVVLYDHYIGVFLYNYPFLEYFYVNIFTIVWCFLLFLLFSRIHVKHLSIIALLEQYSVGIYIIHWPILKAFVQYTNGLHQYNILYAIIICALSFFITYILSRGSITKPLVKLS